MIHAFASARAQDERSVRLARLVAAGFDARDALVFSAPSDERIGCQLQTADGSWGEPFDLLHTAGTVAMDLELWERFAARELIPMHWVDDPTRRFAHGNWPSAFPPNLGDALALVVDPGELLALEALARETARMLVGMMPLAHLNDTVTWQVMDLAAVRQARANLAQAPCERALHAAGAALLQVVPDGLFVGREPLSRAMVER